MPQKTGIEPEGAAAPSACVLRKATPRRRSVSMTTTLWTGVQRTGVVLARPEASNDLSPDGAQVRNPSFDVTPHQYITAIITERGVFKPPFIESLADAGARD